MSWFRTEPIAPEPAFGVRALWALHSVRNQERLGYRPRDIISRVRLLYESAREFGVELTQEQLDRFDAYYRHLVEWNTRINLTAITGREEVRVLHFLDSLSVACALPHDALAGRKLIDVGAGAGFPGVPLAIAFPGLRVTLLEATGKKAAFLDDLARALALDNVTTLRGRAEELGRREEYREQFDLAVARAVAQMRTLVEYTLPFVRANGIFVASKGIDASEETQAATGAIQLLGGRVKKLVPVVLPTLDAPRYLVVIGKVSPTPARYPRRTGVPSKRPL
jgi:16S rRNA (guanine527-N7)-methyltransferase